MFQYSMICTKVEIEGVEYDTYGITGNGVTIEDISTEKSVIESFVNLINKTGDVDPIHIADLVENLLVALS